MDALQADIDTLEQEKLELKERLSVLSKKTLLEGLTRQAGQGTINTVMTLSFWTDRSGQTVQTQIRLLVEEQSDHGFHCLPFPLHHFDKKT